MIPFAMLNSVEPEPCLAKKKKSAPSSSFSMYSSVDDSTMPAADSGHIPVLLNEALELLSPRAGVKLLDGTFGGGGHSRAFLDAAQGVRLVALDRDPDALVRASERMASYGERFRIVHMNFGDLGDFEEFDFDGVFFDFGLSSFQLDTAERGFSFRADAPVDMRMNTETAQSAAEFLETADEESLVRAVRNYGEEKRWRRVIQAIVQARGSGKLQRTQTLADLVAQAVGPSPRGRCSIHPATRTFQGIRIEVNDELRAIEEGLPAAFERLKSGGVLAAISFHSLEDRIVKRFCRRMAGRPEHARDNRTQDEREVLAEMIATRAIQPTEEEMALNPRSRSARMRAIRKLT